MTMARESDPITCVLTPLDSSTWCITRLKDPSEMRCFPLTLPWIAGHTFNLSFFLIYAI